MTSAEWHSTLFQFIGLILSLVTFIGSIVAIYYTYQNLKEMKKQLAEQKNQYFEQNRGNPVFYISKNRESIIHSLIIKNFGNSPAKLISLKITPDFRSYPDKSFDIEICYETCGKLITENYSIDIDFIGNLLTMEPEIKDELSALKNINKSITALSDKFI